MPPSEARGLKPATDTTHRPALAGEPMSFSSVLLWTAAMLLLPVLFIAWLTESRTDRARRWRAAGWSQQRIATRLGCSRYQVRRMLG